jgi:hypothetical protein
MAERIVKVICFCLVAAFCALAGGTALYFLNYDISAKDKADRVQRAITLLKGMGPKVEEIRRSENRFPTESEVYCNLKPCEQGDRVIVRLVPEHDGSFSLTHTSLGVMFTPLDDMYTTWRSRDGTTDRDGWGRPWRWYLRYFLIALVDVAVILLPWGYLTVLWVHKRREKQVGVAAS